MKTLFLSIALLCSSISFAGEKIEVTSDKADRLITALNKIDPIFAVNQTLSASTCRFIRTEGGDISFAGSIQHEIDDKTTQFELSTDDAETLCYALLQAGAKSSQDPTEIMVISTLKISCKRDVVNTCDMWLTDKGLVVP